MAKKKPKAYPKAYSPGDPGVAKPRTNIVKPTIGPTGSNRRRKKYGPTGSNRIKPRG